MSTSKKKINFPRKTKPDGTPNPKYIDVLREDKPLSGQRWGVFSFLTPKFMKKREMFFFEEFVKQWEMSKSMEKFHGFLQFISYKYKLQIDDIMKDFEEFIKEERELIVSSSLDDDFKNFLDKNEEELGNKFDIAHNFQTSIAGVMNRGNYATEDEARLRAKLLVEQDAENNEGVLAFDTTIGPIGQMLPWDPEPYKTGDVQYLEEELNQLAHEKIKNERIAKQAFDARVQKAKEQAIEDNKRNAEKYGNVLTQDIDEHGNLVGVGNVSIEQSFTSQIGAADETVTSDTVRRELFEGDNIVVGKTDYGKSLLKSGPFASKQE